MATQLSMHFKQFLTLFICTCLSVAVHAQYKIANYKTEADNIVYKCYVPALHPKISCSSVVLSFSGNDEETEFDYDEVKGSSKLFDYIKFMYSFDSDYLDQDFLFDVTVSKEGELFHDSAFANNIPRCVRMQTYCGFISKAMAMQIAIMDSIAYPESLVATFSWNEDMGTARWFVTSPPSSHELIPTHKKQINRFIDAITGEIIKTDGRPVK